MVAVLGDKLLKIQLLQSHKQHFFGGLSWSSLVPGSLMIFSYGNTNAKRWFKMEVVTLCNNKSLYIWEVKGQVHPRL